VELDWDSRATIASIVNQQQQTFKGEAAELWQTAIYLKKLVDAYERIIAVLKFIDQFDEFGIDLVLALRA